VTKEEREARAFAASILAVANTPLFVVRKLRERPDILTLALSMDIADIAEKLKKSAGSSPRNVRESAAPYLYATLLSMRGDARSIASVLRVNPSYRWFGNIAEFLIKTTVSTSRKSIDLTGSFDESVKNVYPITHNASS